MRVKNFIVCITSRSIYDAGKDTLQDRLFISLEICTSIPYIPFLWQVVVALSKRTIMEHIKYVHTYLEWMQPIVRIMLCKKQ